MLTVITTLSACGTADPVTAERSQPNDVGHLAQQPPTVSSNPIAPAQAKATAVVTAFAAAWAQPDLTPSDWHAAIAPFCTPRFAALLRAQHPAIPARRITAAATLVRQQIGVLTYVIPTDAGDLIVTVIGHAGQWQIDGATFSQPGNLISIPPQPAQR
jgi:hypothetical protein